MSWAKRAAELRERAAEVGSYALEHGGKIATVAKEKAIVYGQVAGENLAHAAKETKDAAERAQEKWKREREEREREKEQSEKPKFAGMIFGVPLQMAIDNSRLSPEVDLPALVVRCLQFIEDNALSEQGLYRISASQSAVQRLKAAFDDGNDVDINAMTDIVDPHTVAGCLKLYIRELPEPLIPATQAKALNSVKPNSPTLNAELISAFSKLPRANLSLISHLLLHLQKVTFNAEENKMPPSNLAIVFGVTLAVDANLLAAIICNASDVVGGFVDVGALRGVPRAKQKPAKLPAVGSESRDFKDRARRGMSDYEGLRKKKSTSPSPGTRAARRTVSGSGYSFSGATGYSSLDDTESENPFFSSTLEDDAEEMGWNEGTAANKPGQSSVPLPNGPRPALPPRTSQPSNLLSQSVHDNSFTSGSSIVAKAPDVIASVERKDGNSSTISLTQTQVLTSAGLAAGLNRGLGPGGGRERNRSGEPIGRPLSDDPFAEDGDSQSYLPGSVPAKEPTTASTSDESLSNPFASQSGSPNLPRANSNPFASNESIGPKSSPKMSPPPTRNNGRAPFVDDGSSTRVPQPNASAAPLGPSARRLTSSGSVSAAVSKFDARPSSSSTTDGRLRSFGDNGSAGATEPPLRDGGPGTSGGLPRSGSNSGLVVKGSHSLEDKETVPGSSGTGARPSASTGTLSGGRVGRTQPFTTSVKPAVSSTNPFVQIAQVTPKIGDVGGQNVAGGSSEGDGIRTLRSNPFLMMDAAARGKR
ncbi:RalA-binding protein 1 [Gonapodya sp. JEL0774]|nr:RalA-binding protein 1 [Gonapodya sp. JEL0774]